MAWRRLMNFYIYSITYWENEVETKEEKGIMAANSYADAMAEVDEWDWSIEEVRLREISGVCQGLDSERPWVSIEDLAEAFEEAGIQLPNKSAYRCSCGKKDNRPVLNYGGDCVNDK